MTNSLSTLGFQPKPFKWLLLASLFGLAMFVGGADILDAFTRDRTGEPVHRSAISFVHLLMAVPILLLAPLQFSRRIRARWPKLHRWIGRVFLSFCLVASLGAMYLGVTYKGVGSRTPLCIFSILWFAFTIAAWLCARRRLFAAHERFAVRVYAIALAFAFVRLLGEFQPQLFPFMPDQALRDATGEWLSFVLPLLCVEAWYTWWPALRIGGSKT